MASEAQGYAALPVAPHDTAFMTGPKPLAAYERLVEARRALQSLLEDARTSDEAMLEQMRSARR